MAPVLFHVGPLPVYGYGAMLLLAFVAAVIVFTLELRRRQLEPRIARDLTLMSERDPYGGGPEADLRGRALSSGVWERAGRRSPVMAFCFP
jgi:hypothetical protein